MAFIPVAQVGHGVLRPLVGLGQQHAILEFAVHMSPQLFQKGVRLGEILAVRALAFIEIWHGVKAQAVDPHIEPEIDHMHGWRRTSGLS